jgi:holo-[acyl-carrier protein] synthase
MILGLGTDLVAISRVEEILSRHKERFLHRVFTRAEQAECLGRARPATHLAARLAAKEATMKALGTGWGFGVRWQDIEVESGGRTPPALRLVGQAKRHAEARGVRQALVSLSHDGDYAIAVVLATD